MFRNTEESVL